MLALFVCVQSYAQTDSLRISIASAWSLVKEQHLLLKVKEKEVEAAQAAVKQERLLENPELSVSHNVNNPVTHHYFEVNREGQTDIQLSQRIFIAGQRRQRVRKAMAELRGAEAEYGDAMRLLRRELSLEMIRLAGVQEKLAVLEREIASTERILKAFEQQEQKGNIAAAEVMRIRSQYLQLLQERTEMEADIVSGSHSIAVALGEEGHCIVPVIDFAASVSVLDTVNIKHIMGSLADRPDMRAYRQSVAAAEHDIKLQRANAWPELKVTGEWDKNGSIGRNFFAVGIGLTLPIFNQNQGNIRAARSNREARQLDYEWNRSRETAELMASWQKLQSSLRLATEAERHIEASRTSFVSDVERQFLARNISLLELIDYYQAHRESHYLLIDSRMEVLEMMAELDMEIK